ncbi:MAG: hypothetical protein AAFU85_23980, partial [Planctomycetota bacterium]
IDYRNGTDTLAECLAIPTVVVIVFLIVGMMVWHHRTQFLRPELERFEGMLSEWQSDKEAQA